MTEIRQARADESQLLAAVQELASIAALAHIFPPEAHPYPREAVQARGPWRSWSRRHAR